MKRHSLRHECRVAVDAAAALDGVRRGGECADPVVRGACAVVDTVEAIPACDLVTVPARQGLEAVDLLRHGAGVGPVLHDGTCANLGFLVPPGTAEAWDVPGSSCAPASGGAAEWLVPRMPLPRSPTPPPSGRPSAKRPARSRWPTPARSRPRGRPPPAAHTCTARHHRTGRALQGQRPAHPAPPHREGASPGGAGRTFSGARGTARATHHRQVIRRRRQEPHGAGGDVRRRLGASQAQDP